MFPSLSGSSVLNITDVLGQQNFTPGLKNEKKDLIMIKDLCGFGKLNALCTGDTEWRRLIDKFNSQSGHRTHKKIWKTAQMEENLFYPTPIVLYLNHLLYMVTSSIWFLTSIWGYFYFFSPIADYLSSSNDIVLIDYHQSKYTNE